MIFFGKATFDADGWANYSAVPEPSPAKWGRLESIWFVGKTAIAQTSRPSLTFCMKLMSSEVSGMSQGCGIRGYILRVSFKTNSTFISLTTGSRTNGWWNTCHHSGVLDLNPRASTATPICPDENHLNFFLPKVPEFRWWIATHTTCALQLAAARLQCSRFPACSSSISRWASLLPRLSILSSAI